MDAATLFLAPARTLFRCQPVVGRGSRPSSFRFSMVAPGTAGSCVFQCTVRNADTVELHLKAPERNSRKRPRKHRGAQLHTPITPQTHRHRLLKSLRRSGIPDIGSVLG